MTLQVGTGSRLVNIRIPHYLILGRPNLEYCIQFCSLIFKGKMEKLEKRAVEVLGSEHVPRTRIRGLFRWERG